MLFSPIPPTRESHHAPPPLAPPAPVPVRVNPAQTRPSRVRLNVECLEDRTVPSITLASANFSATVGTAFNGTVATFTDSNAGAVASNFTGTINWGDSATSPGDGNAVQILADPVTSGQFNVKGTHTYTAAGSFTVTATVTDNLGNSSTATAFYSQANLVTDNQANLATAGFTAAAHVNPNLVNPWGISFAPSGPFWIANNGTGTTTLYDGTGTTQGGTITIPASSNTGATSPAPVTGTVANTTSDFDVAGPGTSALFIFATTDGTIAAWYAGSSATIEVNNTNFTTGPVYKGLAIGSNSNGNFLYAADFRTGTIDVFDKNFQPVTLGQGGFGTFTDPTLTAGFAPFNVQNLGGKLYVTYALQNAAKNSDVGGAGNGFVNVFDTSGNFIKRLMSNGPLDSPWGLAIAPSTFGSFANDLLVGNFKGGNINAFDPNTGSLSRPAYRQQRPANRDPRPLGPDLRQRQRRGQRQHALFHRRHQPFGRWTFRQLHLRAGLGRHGHGQPRRFRLRRDHLNTDRHRHQLQLQPGDLRRLTTYTFVIDGQSDSLNNTQLAHVVVNGVGTALPPS